MTKRQLFAAAHAITRQTIKRGDDYRTTFGASLRLLSAAAKGDIVASDAIWQLGTDAVASATDAINYAERAIAVGYNTAETVNAAVANAVAKADHAVAVANVANAIADHVAETLPRGKGRAKAISEARDTADAIAPLAADRAAWAGSLAA